MYPFNAGTSLKARKVSIQINFDKNVVNCLVDGKKKGLVFNGPKDLRKTSFGLFIETKNQGSKVEILNKQISAIEENVSDMKKEVSDIHHNIPNLLHSNVPD